MGLKKTIEYDRSREVVDGQTGELLVQEREQATKTVYDKEPDFIKLYLKDIVYLAELPKSYANLLMHLVKFMSWPTEEYGLTLTLSPFMRAEICKALGYSNKTTLNNALTTLVKKDILRRLGTGTYQFNPFLFGKGNWTDIAKIRATWEYTAAGRSLKDVSIEKQEDS